MIRCYNCGEEGHRTQQCKEYGPYFPEPGKSSQDYGDQSQRIADLFAEDIITEHRAGHYDQAEIKTDGAGPSAIASSAGTGDHPEQTAGGS